MGSSQSLEQKVMCYKAVERSKNSLTDLFLFLGCRVFDFIRDLHAQSITAYMEVFIYFVISFLIGEDPFENLDELADINLVASVLKLYFRELPEPLFPTTLFPQFMECASEYKALYPMFTSKSPSVDF